MRPIDADALIEKCGDWYVEEGTESGFIGTLKNLLSTMPTVQHEKAQLSQEGTTKDATSDLISRQAAIDLVTDMEFMNFTAKGILRDSLRKLSPAQPEPQEGHWINGKCDLCGEHAPFWAMASTYHESNYCPCCGAKMKGVKHETD